MDVRLPESPEDLAAGRAATTLVDPPSTALHSGHPGDAPVEVTRGWMTRHALRPYIRVPCVSARMPSACI